MSMQSNAVKTADELALIRKAVQIIDDVYDFVLASAREGMTEIELADMIANKIAELGGDGTSFDTIVAFGENGCEPHHVPNDKKLEKGVLVTVDMGALYKGYCSDFTRTFAFGKPSQRQVKIYDIVREAQKRAVASVQAGVSCKSVDAAARDYITENGYGEEYVHGTGHGVGTLIHEAPTLKAISEEYLEDNMAVTVEPGIYIKDELGVRIEDVVIVGENIPLSRHATALIVVNP